MEASFLRLVNVLLLVSLLRNLRYLWFITPLRRIDENSFIEFLQLGGTVVFGYLYFVGWPFHATPDNYTIAVVLSYLRIVETFAYPSKVVLVAPYKQGPQILGKNRSVLMLFHNLLDIVLCFAILYFVTGSTSSVGKLQTFYFSAVTITTLGFGDYRPVDALGEVLVVCQLFIWFWFIMLIFNAIVSQLREGGP